MEQAVFLTKDKTSRYTTHNFRFMVIEDGDVVNWHASSGIAGFGCIARDSSGCILRVRAGNLGNCSSSLDAEGQAVLQAMEMARDANWTQCIFETDCGDIFKVFFMEGRSRLLHKLQWFKFVAWNFVSNRDWRMSLVRREANPVADNLATKAVTTNWTWSSTDAVPLNFN